MLTIPKQVRPGEQWIPPGPKWWLSKQLWSIIEVKEGGTWGDTFVVLGCDGNDYWASLSDLLRDWEYVGLVVPRQGGETR